MKKLNMKEIISYGAGAVTGNGLTQFISLFLLVFFTDMLGLSVGTAGLIYTSVGWLSSLADSIAGYLSDKTGKYKTWMMWGAGVTAVLFVLLFTKWDMPSSSAVWYAFIAYFAWSCAYSIYSISYNAMASAMTSDSETRTKLSSARFAFLAIPAIAISVVSPYLTGGHSDSGFYTKAAAVFALIGIIFVLPCILFVKEPRTSAKKEKMSPRDILSSFIGNKQLIVISAAYFLYMVGFNVYYTTMTYFFKYHYVSEKIMSWVLIMNAPLSFFVSLLMPIVVKNAGKLRAFTITAIIFIASMITMFFMADNGVMIFICNILVLFALNLMSPIMTVMIADAIDYGVWKTGKNVRAMGYAVISLFGKISTGLSGLVVGGVLSHFGYIANQAQTDGAKMGIVLSYCVVPAAIFGAIIFILNLGWKLNEKYMKEIAASLDKRSIGPDNELPPH